MKKLIHFLSIVSLTLLLVACSKDIGDGNCPDSLPVKLETVVIERSVKGWELYSWPGADAECRKWNYVLLAGTNRLRTYSEVTNDTSLHVTGEKQLRLLLNKFPSNEHILWVGEKWLSNAWGQSSINYRNLQLPNNAVRNEIKQHAIRKGLNLAIAP